MHNHGRRALTIAALLVLAVIVIPSIWIEIANGNGGGYLTKIPPVILGLAVFIGLFNLVSYFVLELRLRKLRAGHPNSLFVQLIGRDDTMIALSEGDAFTALPSRPYVMEINDDGIRLWRRVRQPSVFANVPRETIVRVASGPGRLGVRRVTCLLLTVRTRTGNRDIPLYPAGEGARMLVNRATEGVEKLQDEIITRLRIEVLPTKH